MTIVDDEIAFLADIETRVRARRFELIASQPPTFFKKPISVVGVNFFDGSVAPSHVNYKMPLKDSMWAYWRARGITVARVAFKWERAQPTLGGTLAPQHLADMHAVVEMARANDMAVLWDMHNYGKREGTALIGQTGSTLPMISRSQFNDFWIRFATEMFSYDNVIGYGLMNEPSASMPGWPTTVQEAINAIRLVENRTAIFIGGIGAGHAWEWPTRNGNLAFLTDPANRLVFEAHQYPDQTDHSGKFTNDFNYALNVIWVKNLPDPMDFHVKLVDDFTGWLGTTRRGAIGETGVPSANLWDGTTWRPSVKFDTRWVEVLRRAIIHCADRKVPVFQWTDGVHAASDLLAVSHAAPTPGAVIDMLAAVNAQYPVIG